MSLSTPPVSIEIIRKFATTLRKHFKKNKSIVLSQKEALDIVAIMHGARSYAHLTPPKAINVLHAKIDKATSTVRSWLGIAFTASDMRSECCSLDHLIDRDDNLSDAETVAVAQQIMLSALHKEPLTFGPGLKISEDRIVALAYFVVREIVKNGVKTSVGSFTSKDGLRDGDRYYLTIQGENHSLYRSPLFADQIVNSIVEYVEKNNPVDTSSSWIQITSEVSDRRLSRVALVSIRVAPCGAYLLGWKKADGTKGLGQLVESELRLLSIANYNAKVSSFHEIVKLVGDLSFAPKLKNIGFKKKGNSYKRERLGILQTVQIEKTFDRHFSSGCGEVAIYLCVQHRKLLVRENLQAIISGLDGGWFIFDSKYVGYVANDIVKAFDMVDVEAWFQQAILELPIADKQYSPVGA